MVNQGPENELNNPVFNQTESILGLQNRFERFLVGREVAVDEVVGH